MLPKLYAPPFEFPCLFIYFCGPPKYPLLTGYQKYNKLHDASRAQYEKEMVEFEKKHPKPPKKYVTLIYWTASNNFFRALSAYLFYSTAARPAFAKQFPTESMTDLSKRIAAKWQTLSAAEKKVTRRGRETIRLTNIYFRNTTIWQLKMLNDTPRKRKVLKRNRTNKLS